MFRLFLLIIIGILSISTVENAIGEKSITGKITHIGSNTLDRNSQVEVSLRDVSLMDVKSKLIASTVISNATTFPISYKLKYNPSDIKSGLTYSLSARITGPGNKLSFINDVHTPAKLTGTASPTIDIAVIRVGVSSSTAATKLNGQKVCGPLKCYGATKVCPYGYEKKDGCDICRCNDPCNPSGKSVLCGSKKRCFVEKKADGTFGTRCAAAPGKRRKGGKSKKESSKAECNLPKAVGMCRAAFSRFYYNSATKNCEAFMYGGCDGNGNNFATKVKCEEACKA